jgi:transcriptional regulator with XRE-family HTH domain
MINQPTRKKLGRPQKSEPLDTRGGRLLYAIEKAGYTQQSFAKEMGCSGSTLNKIVHNEVDDTTWLIKFAVKLNVPAEWLQFGHTKNCVQIIQDGKIREIKTSDDHPPFNLGVPWYKWDYIPTKTIDEKSLPQKEFIKGGSWRTICLVIEDDINLSPDMYVNDFHKGDIIYIDPEIPPSDGCMVLAYIKGDATIVFRQYMSLRNKWWLRTLNPQFPAIMVDERITILGVCYAKVNYRDVFNMRRKRDISFKKNKK